MSHNLSGKQARALDALMTEGTVEGAATKAAMHVRTLYRWISTPTFVAAYREARRQAVQRATAHLQHAASDAVSTLTDVMKDPEVAAPARVNAAKAVLEFAIKAIEIEDLTARIEALERAPTRPA